MIALPTFRTKYGTGYPSTGKPPDRAEYIPLTELLTRPFETDAHFAAYSSASHQFRLKKDASIDASPEVLCLVLDLDDESAHKLGEEASKAWRIDMRARFAELLATHPGAYIYGTRGGYRVVYALPEPFRIIGDGKEWRNFYARACCYLSRLFNLTPDVGCSDWTRLYRVPGATRDGVPQDAEVIGGEIAAFDWSPVAATLDADIAIAEANGSPQWLSLAKLISPPKNRNVPKPVSGTRYGEVALERSAAEVASTGSGARDNVLNAKAYSLGRIAEAARLDDSAIESTLCAAAMNAGLSEKQAISTIRCALVAGRANPVVPLPADKRIANLASLPSDVDRHKGIRELAKEEGVPITVVRSQVQAAINLVKAPSPDSWRSNLMWKQTAQGQTLEQCLRNAAIFLTHHEDWAGHIRWNTFAGRIESLGAPIDAEDGPWSDLHTAQATAWLQAKAHLMLGTDVVRVAVELAAPVTSYHPVRDYLEALEWDQEPRLDFWLDDLCGVDRTPYSMAVGRRWMISAIARIMDPGCKVDHALILEGPQGGKKSTLFAALFNPWFTDDVDTLGSKDSAMQIRGVWCVELSELDSMRRSDITTIKAFISRRVDRFRPPYGRALVEAPRTVVFAGSTNRDQYLADETGGRRFWCIRARTLDPKGATAQRDQLWAEALTAYRAGEAWWLEEEALVEAAQEQQELRYTEDSWEEKIDAALSPFTWPPGDPITAGSVLSAIGVETSRQDRSAQMRVAASLKRLKYEKGARIVHDGFRIYPWVRKL